MSRIATTPAQVELSLGFPSSTDGDAYANLQVIDNASRQTLVRVKLTPDEFLQLMRGRVFSAEAAIPDQKGLGRIGRFLSVESTDVPDRYRREREETPDLRLWAEGECARRGFDEFNLSYGRDGWRIVFRKWEAE